MTQPLEAQEIKEIDAAATNAEKCWERIPILGWAIADMMWGKRTRPIAEKIERQLKDRSEPVSAVWGESAAGIALPRCICRVAAQEMGWPNDYFIPEDPAKIVFWAHNDGLDVESAVMEIEEHLDIKLEDAEVEAWFNQTLGEVVDFLWVRQQETHNLENVWPPAPSMSRYASAFREGTDK